MRWSRSGRATRIRIAPSTSIETVIWFVTSRPSCCAALSYAAPDGIRGKAYESCPTALGAVAARCCAAPSADHTRSILSCALGRAAGGLGATPDGSSRTSRWRLVWSYRLLHVRTHKRRGPAPCGTRAFTEGSDCSRHYCGLVGSYEPIVPSTLEPGLSCEIAQLDVLAATQKKSVSGLSPRHLRRSEPEHHSLRRQSGFICHREV